MLSQLNGPPGARVMIVAEAPGRLGGELTGRPLVDDASGRHFSLLLDAAGMDRAQIFITNAVLCNPQTALGRNRRPSRAELAACRHWLLSQIETVDASVLVTLGVTALEALAAISPHSYRLGPDVRKALPWMGRTLIPLYHPSPLTRARRSDAEQLNDYRWLGEYLRAQDVLMPD